MKIIKVVCSYCDFKIQCSDVISVRDLYEETNRLVRCPKCGKYPALQKFYKTIKEENPKQVSLREEIGKIVKEAIEKQMDYESYFEGAYEDPTEKIFNLLNDQTL